MGQKIRISFIIEVLGRPEEHVMSSIEGMIKKINEERGTKVIDSKIHPAKKLEPQKSNPDMELYTTFAELEAEVDDIDALLVLAFNYMPSNIEIISPENFILKKHDISGLVTNTILRLHRYDELAKRFAIDKKILEDKLKEQMKKD